MGQEVKDHLRRALSLMLKPLIRLLIAQGVTHAEFAETAKEVYVETALRHFEELTNSEVAEVLEVPLTHLRDEASIVEVPRQRDGGLTMMEGWVWQDHIIWGATGRMLRNFLNVTGG